MKNVQDIVRDFVISLGGDGLCNVDVGCGCHIDEFPCCDNNFSDCVPAKRTRCDECERGTKGLRTSEEWQNLCRHKVVDPDGWDRDNYNYSWHEEKISRDEFERRMKLSTCHIDVANFEDCWIEPCETQEEWGNDECFRVLTVKTYVSFGQVHRHEIDGQIFDVNCLAEIETMTAAEGRARAVELFGEQFCTTYSKISPDDMRFFPRGVIKIK